VSLRLRTEADLGAAADLGHGRIQYVVDRVKRWPRPLIEALFITV